MDGLVMGACLLGLVFVGGSEAAAAERPVVGLYTLTHGQMPNGKKYGGSIEVRPVAGNPSMKWCGANRAACAQNPPMFGLRYDTAGQKYSGVGIVPGYWRLWVGWGQAGVMVFKLHKDGHLQAVWAEAGKRRFGFETATGGSPKDFGGRYSIRGTDPAGTPYTGTLDIAQRAGVYTLTWTAGGSTYQGVGLRQADELGVAWGSKGFGVAFYNISNGTLTSGSWVAFGGKKPGMEVLRRGAPAPVAASRPAPRPRPGPSGAAASCSVTTKKATCMSTSGAMGRKRHKEACPEPFTDTLEEELAAIAAKCLPTGVRGLGGITVSGTAGATKPKWKVKGPKEAKAAVACLLAALKKDVLDGPLFDGDDPVPYSEARFSAKLSCQR